MQRNAFMYLLAALLATVTGQATADEVKSVTVVNTPLPVQVVNPPNAPATVNVGNLADIAKALGLQQPVAFLLTFGPNGVGAPFVVPTGKRLILEFASGRCLTSAASVAELGIDVIDGTNSHSYTFNLPEVSSAGTATGVFSHLVKIYAAAGAAIILNAGSGSNQAGGFVECSATLSGQLVDAQ